MKKIIFSLILLVYGVYAWSQDFNKEDILGKWKLTEETISIVYDDVPYPKVAVENPKNTIYVFGKNGVLNTTFGPGQYRIDGEFLKLHIQNNDPCEFYIYKLTKDELMWASEQTHYFTRSDYEEMINYPGFDKKYLNDLKKLIGKNIYLIVYCVCKKID